MSRRELLKLGAIAATGVAASFVAPTRLSARSKVPPGLAKRAGTGTPTPTPAPTPTPTSTPTPISDTGSSPALYRALDTDFGNYGLQPQSWFDAARSAGYDGFITTLHTYWGAAPQPWPTSHLAIERALVAGMWVAAYGRPVSRWREALSHVPQGLREQLRFFALDIEVEPSGQQHPMRREYADGVRDEFGIRPVIYTGWGMWGDVMGYGTSGFSDIPLWDFSGDRFDWPAAIDEPELVRYGGWNATPETMRVGWQVQMQTPAEFQGVNIDRDVFTRAFIDAT